MKAMPTIARKVIYIILLVAGVASGALAAGYAEIGASRPVWLVFGTAVVAFVGAAAPVVALLHVSTNGTTTETTEIVTPPTPVAPATVAKKTTRKTTVKDAS